MASETVDGVPPRSRDRACGTVSTMPSARTVRESRISFGRMRSCSRHDGQINNCGVRSPRRSTTLVSLPGKYRLFQIGNTGVAPGQHFAELVDQRGRRGVNDPAVMMEPDHTPRALGDGGEVER